MVLQSIIIGILFGLFWGSILIGRYTHFKSPHTCKDTTKLSICFLASTNTIRYLLLAALLGLLVAKQYIVLPWWCVGFFATFWMLTLKTAHTPTKEKNENSNISTRSD